MFSIGDRLTVTYEVVKSLGAGGMGMTFLAQDVVSKQYVAVKTMRPELTSRATLRRRFVRETRIHAGLQHPHIVKIVTANLGVALTPWFAMEYCSGGDMHHAAGRLTWQDVLRLTLSVADALAYAHGRNVIHRDIKPSNILIGGDGAAKLTDFGLAYVTSRGSTKLTGTGNVLGTVDFMAPEQRRSSKDAREVADVFSLAMTLEHALNGKSLPRRVQGDLNTLLRGALLPDPKKRMPLEAMRKGLGKLVAI